MTHYEKQLVAHIRDNATDVNDLAVARKIETLDSDDPWRETLIRDTERKFYGERHEDVRETLSNFKLISGH